MCPEGSRCAGRWTAGGLVAAIHKPLDPDGPLSNLGWVAESDSEGQLVSVFYDLYLKSIDRWARQGEIPFWLLRAYLRHHESRRKFEIVAKTMRDACRIWVAWVDGKPAASIIVLTFGANAYYWRGAMDKELASPTRANYLLHARAIAQACRDGCRYYQMGETGFDPGLAQFKASFGAHPRTRDYAEYRIERLPITTVRNRLRDVASLAGTSGSRIRGWLRRAGPEPPPPG